MSRKYGPKTIDHPSIGKNCPFCSLPFKEGDFTTLIATRPADAEEAEKAAAGRAYTSEAEEVHYDCAVRVKEMWPALPW